MLAEALVRSHVEALKRRMPQPEAAVLGCTHYPLMREVFQEALGPGVRVYSQADLVAPSLRDYLARRPEFLGPGTVSRLLTTGDPLRVSSKATQFLRRRVAFEGRLRAGMRAFIAIPLPDDVSDRLEALQAELSVGRLSDPATFHITLAFLGEEPVERIEAAHEALAGLRAAPFEVRLDGLGLFGGREAKTLFAAVAPSEPLAALQRKVRSLLHGAGLMLDRERFRPHVTLARFRPGEGGDPALARFLARHVGFASVPFAVTGVVLYRSQLTRGGAIHDPLADYPLA